MTVVVSRSSGKSRSQVQVGVASGGKLFAGKWLAFSPGGITIRVPISVGPNNLRLACPFIGPSELKVWPAPLFRTAGSEKNLSYFSESASSDFNTFSTASASSAFETLLGIWISRVPPLSSSNL